MDVSPLLTKAQLADVRARRDQLIALWKALPPGEAWELPFGRVGRPAELQDF